MSRVFKLAFSVLFSLLFRCCSGASTRNITIDDTGTSYIWYSEGWDITPIQNPFNYGGFHHLSSSKSATASFTFTGIAVYILSPKWPYNVASHVIVDSLPHTSSYVDLRDYSRSFDPSGGPETVNTSAVWGASDLKNIQHTLWIRFASNADFIALDGIVYTVLEEEDEDDSAPGTESTSTPLPQPKVNALAIGLGVGVSVAGLILFAAALLIFCRRRKRQRVQMYQEALASSVDPYAGLPLVPPQPPVPSFVPDSRTVSVYSVNPSTSAGSASVMYNPYTETSYPHTVLSYDTHQHQQTSTLSYPREKAEYAPAVGPSVADTSSSSATSMIFRHATEGDSAVGGYSPPPYSGKTLRGVASQ